MEELRALETKGDLLTLIKEVKRLVAEDKAVFKQPFIKQWCAKRWRFFFINEAVKDPVAMAAADKKGLLTRNDPRPDRQKIAERFFKTDAMLDWKLEMPEAQMNPIENTTLLFCPGMLTGLLPVRAFQEAFPAIHEKYGWPILRSDLHPMRDCEANMEDLLKSLNQGLGLTPDCKVIEPENAVPPKDVFIISYSKGTPDVLTLLVNYPEIKDRIRCIFNWAGAPGGSYLADDIYNALKDLPVKQMENQLNKIMNLISPVIDFKQGALRRLDEFDIVPCIRSMNTNVRQEFNEIHAETIANMGIPIFNLTGSTSPTEVPYFQIQGTLDLNKYDSNNDMQVTQAQAKVHNEMATDLVMLHGHHWDLSYSPFPKGMRMGSPNLDHPFPKEAAAMAMFQLASELGLID